MKFRSCCFLVFIVLVFAVINLSAETLKDSLPPIKDNLPQNMEQLWAGWNPNSEPLNVQVCKEWRQDGVVCQVIRYQVGIFKGVPAMMAGVYAYPENAKNVPGLVQVHGGGQFAQVNEALIPAKRGYACISLNWGGKKIAVPDYEGPDTDWGGVNGAQIGPNQYDENKDSPRNNKWFLRVMAARRALTFLQQRPEVDPACLGMFGHSMGGQLTLFTAAVDKRIKAAAPSCGAGVRENWDPDDLQDRTLGLAVSAKALTCAVIFLNPLNDINGTVDDVERTVRMMPAKEYRYTRQPHMNHRSTGTYLVPRALWFDEHLKGTFKVPETPETTLVLTRENGVPLFRVNPDQSKPIKAIDIFYSRGEKPAERFWIHAKAKREGGWWEADCPVLDLNMPLRVVANVHYALDKPIEVPGFYHQDITSEEYVISSKMDVVTPEDLKAAGIGATDKRSNIIDDFSESMMNWYTLTKSDKQWSHHSRILSDPKFQAPPMSKLVLEVKSQKSNKLVISIGSYSAEVELKGGGDWQEVSIYPTEMHHEKLGATFLEWPKHGELVISTEGKWNWQEASKQLGGDWRGSHPDFHMLRWASMSDDELSGNRQFRLGQIPIIGGKTYLDIRYADQLRSGYPSRMQTLDTFSIDKVKTSGQYVMRGICVRAPGEIVFFLGKNFKNFHVEPGLENRSKNASYEIYADGKKLIDSLENNGEQNIYDFPIKNISELRLVINGHAGGNSGDEVRWVNAYLQ